MEVYTPSFKKVRNLLERQILNFIGDNFVASSTEINSFVQNLKEENKEKYESIIFTYSYPYSSQIQDLLVDLVRRCVVKQTREGYELTSYGLRLIGMDI